MVHFFSPHIKTSHSHLSHSGVLSLTQSEDVCIFFQGLVFENVSLCSLGISDLQESNITASIVWPSDRIQSHTLSLGKGWSSCRAWLRKQGGRLGGSQLEKQSWVKVLGLYVPFLFQGTSDRACQGWKVSSGSQRRWEKMGSRVQVKAPPLQMAEGYFSARRGKTEHVWRQLAFWQSTRGPYGLPVLHRKQEHLHFRQKLLLSAGD